MKTAYPRILALVAALGVAPLFFSRRMRVVQRSIVRAKPACIFPYLNDLRNWPLWAEWPQRETVSARYSGAESGAGARLEWESVWMDGVLTLTCSVADQHVAYSLERADGRQPLEGILALEEIGGVTRVTWVCSWVAHDVPWLRYADLVRKWSMGRELAAGLENLRALVEAHHGA